MVRSIGIAAVVMGLAWTGLAGAQSPAPPGAAPSQRYMVVREEGKPPQRCLLLKTWQQPNGIPAYQVQAVDSGEVITVVGSTPPGSSGNPRTSSSRIYRWGRDNLPPEGAPVAPPTANGLSAPLPLGPYAPRSPSTAAPSPSALPPLSPSPQPALTARQPDTILPPAAPARSNSIVRNNGPLPSQNTQAVQQPYLSKSKTPAVPQLAATKQSVSTSGSATPPPMPPALSAQKTVTPPALSAQKTVTPPTLSAAMQSTSIVRNNGPLPPQSTPVAQQSPIRPSSSGASQFGTPKPSASTSLLAAPPPSSAILTARKPDALPPPVVSTQSNSIAPNNPPPQTPARNTPVPNELPVWKTPPPASTQPRLVPTAGGTVVSQTPCDCACPPKCDACGKPCNACCQNACVCEPTPKRQPILGRLFKSNSSGASTAVVCQPPPPTVKPAVPPPPPATVVKAPTGPAKPGDWRESWGEVKPYKAPIQANNGKPAELVKRVDPTPVRMDPPKKPDPLHDPEHYRDLAMNARLSNSTIPKETQPSAAPMNPPVVAPNPPVGLMPPAQPPIRVIQMAADEPNAFWVPQKPSAAAKETPINNGFDRQANAPPQGVPPEIAAQRRPLIGPRGPMVMMPRPPDAPRPFGPPPRAMAQSMPPDTGVPDAMANAFTVAGTRRPIPADFGGTPQEPNGFDRPMQGDGSPPLAYGMDGMGMPRPPMPNMMAMGPRGPMPANPMMSVPPTPPSAQAAGFANASAPPTGVPQLLSTLKDSLYPSERETAAEQLSELNWRIQPLVVESLMKSAREDPAATVRASCVHALAHMKVNSTEAVALVRDLKTDRDPRVRQEAEEALATLGDSGIQQTSHK
ncbi:MAG: HEAT repeat domain-containing protein [Gemmataceae bacterium]